MTLRFAVIGAGVVGAAAALALARRGADVTVFEQYGLGHDRGSSHGPTRLFRTAYFEHPDYVPLLKRAGQMWRALERDSRQSLLEMCGVVMAGREDSVLISGTLQAARDHDLRLERLTRRECASRFSYLTLASDMGAMIEPEAGFLYADRAIAAMLALARDRGVAIHERAPVAAWRSEQAGVAVETADGWRSFDRLVAAPGAYASRLLGAAGALVRPMRKHLFWANGGARRLTDGFLPFAVEESDGRFFYGFPAIDAQGVKIGEHTGGAFIAAPEDDAAEAGRQARADAAAFLLRCAPSLTLGPKEQSCLYETSPDSHFIIDKHRDDARAVFAIGLSGHGFKFAPVIGEALADLAIDGETIREFDFLKLSRFEC